MTKTKQPVTFEHTAPLAYALWLKSYTKKYMFM